MDLYAPRTTLSEILMPSADATNITSENNGKKSNKIVDMYAKQVFVNSLETAATFTMTTT